MPYTSTFYPEFQDIKVAHFHGWDPHSVFLELGMWMGMEAHKNYRYIGHSIHYLDPVDGINCTKTVTEPDQDFYVEAVIIYTEN